MKRRYLVAKIKTYYGYAEKQKKRADRFYASYCETKNMDDYRQSQYYYRKAEESLQIAHNYEQMLQNGEYEPD